jgi:hypothetical protein
MDFSYKAEGRVEQLKQRVKRCVCTYCGKPLRLKRIIFNEVEDARIEIYCDYCDRIEFGVEQEIYRSALFFVDEIGFNCYPDLENNEKTKRMNVAKVCEIMAWGNRNIGILSKDGFEVPLKMNENLMGECLVLSDEELDEIEDIVMY